MKSTDKLTGFEQTETSVRHKDVLRVGVTPVPAHVFGAGNSRQKPETVHQSDSPLFYDRTGDARVSEHNTEHVEQVNTHPCLLLKSSVQQTCRGNLCGSLLSEIRFMPHTDNTVSLGPGDVSQTIGTQARQDDECSPRLGDNNVTQSRPGYVSQTPGPRIQQGDVHTTRLDSGNVIPSRQESLNRITGPMLQQPRSSTPGANTCKDQLSECLQWEFKEFEKNFDSLIQALVLNYGIGEKVIKYQLELIAVRRHTSSSVVDMTNYLKKVVVRLKLLRNM